MRGLVFIYMMEIRHILETEHLQVEKKCHLSIVKLFQPLLTDNDRPPPFFFAPSENVKKEKEILFSGRLKFSTVLITT